MSKPKDFRKYSDIFDHPSETDTTPESPYEDGPQEKVVVLNPVEQEQLDLEGIRTPWIKSHWD